MLMLHKLSKPLSKKSQSIVKPTWNVLQKVPFDFYLSYGQVTYPYVIEIFVDNAQVQVSI